MSKFIKKPVEVEAIQFQWNENNPNVGAITNIEQAIDKIANFTGKNDISIYFDVNQIAILGMVMNRGDWIVKNGEQYTAVKDELFQLQYAPCDSWLDRCRIERDEVKARLDGLTTALDKEKPSFVTDQDWLSMFNQQFHMRMYHQSVSDRVARNEPKPNFVEFAEVKPVEKEQGSESKLGTLEA